MLGNLGLGRLNNEVVGWLNIVEVEQAHLFFTVGDRFQTPQLQHRVLGNAAEAAVLLGTKT
jgi:hypothetical protein